MCVLRNMVILASGQLSPNDERVDFWNSVVLICMDYLFSFLVCFNACVFVRIRSVWFWWNMESPKVSRMWHDLQKATSRFVAVLQLIIIITRQFLRCFMWWESLQGHPTTFRHDSGIMYKYWQLIHLHLWLLYVYECSMMCLYYCILM